MRSDGEGPGCGRSGNQRTWWRAGPWWMVTVTVPHTVPTVAEAQALHGFLQARNDDEWKAVLAEAPTSTDRPDDLPPHFESVRRLTVSHKLALGTAFAFLLQLIDTGTPEQA